MADKKLGIIEGIILAIIPAIGYWFAYLYELGYCDYFNIPTFYIDVSIHSVLASIIGTVLVYASFHVIADIFYGGYYKFPRSIQRRVKILLTVLFIYIGLGITTKFSAFEWGLYFIAMVFPVVVAEFIGPMVTQRKVQGYVAQVEAQDQAEAKYGISLFDNWANKIGLDNLSTILFIYLASYFVFIAGGLVARTKTNFEVIQGNPQLVVLKQYNNYLVAAEFNRSKLTISNKFKILPIKESFTYEKLGSLSPKHL